MNIIEKARIFATAAHAAVKQVRKYTGEINGTWFVNDHGACEQTTSTPVFDMFDMVEVVLETREVEENV
jgi:hypothetical protein